MNIRFVFAAFIAAAALSGCGSAEKTQPDNTSEGMAADSGEKIPVAISLPNENAYNRKRAQELTNRLWQKGFDIILEYADGSPETQNDQIEALGKRGIECLIVSPTDPEKTDISSIKDKDISVINLDNLIGKDVDCFLYYDGRAIGKAVGDYVVKEKLPGLKKGATVEFFMGSRDGEGRDFFEGFMSAADPYIEDGRLCSVTGRTTYESVSTEAKTEEVVFNDAKRLLSGYYINEAPDICITASDDIADRLGDYFISQGCKKEKMPFITGLDGDETAPKNFERGSLSLTVFKDSSKEADVCADIVRTLVEDGSLSDLPYIEPGRNMEGVPSARLETELLTSKNYKERLVDSGYYKNDGEN